MQSCPKFKLHAAVVLALLLSAAVPAAASMEDAFERATAQYRQGRYSDAYGRFLDLAGQGDPDAARIVLFMHAFGPPLYGSHWDLSTEQRDAFARQAASKKAREPLPFQPSWQAPSRSGARAAVPVRQQVQR